MEKEALSLVYYHALYNVLQHAAAYVATFALLVSVGIVLSTSQRVSPGWPRLYLDTVIGLAGIAAGYSLARWYVFSKIVNATPGVGDAITKTVWVAPGCLATIGAVVTFIIVVFDFLVLHKR